MLIPVLACLALAGCHRDIRSEAAVRQGVLDYLSTRQGLNVASMNVSVTNMVFRENQVFATVTFTPKAAGPGQPMTIAYTLEKNGDRWVVKPRADTANPHGGAMGASPHGGAMGMPQDPGSPGALPPGHPTMPPKDGTPK